MTRVRIKFLQNISKSEYSAKLLEANEKYRITLEENEVLKEKVDVLFKLGRSYINKASCNKPEDTNKEEVIEVENANKISETVTEDSENDESGGNNDASFTWATNKYRGFRRVVWKNNFKGNIVIYSNYHVLSIHLNHFKSFFDISCVFMGMRASCYFSLC